MSRCLVRTVRIILAVVLVGLGPWKVGAQEQPVTAEAAILMDRESRRILWEKNIHQTRPMASVTKIMTALLALELGDSGEMVRVSPEAACTEGSSIWLEPGESKSLEELVYGLMLYSGNDAAVAIAEHLAGTVDNFARLMNSRARQLGAVKTNFVNPHGLPDDRHYSTAYDLALISCKALESRKFQNIISTDSRIITWPGHPEGRFLNNQNRLLELYPGANGIKTGWTRKAGRCFAGSATKENWQLVTVVLDAPQMWEDAIGLLDYGFDTYTREKIFSKEQVLAKVGISGGEIDYLPVIAAGDLYLPLLPAENKRLQYRWCLGDSYRSPICKGKEVGKAEVYLDGHKLGEIQLNAGCEVKRVNVWQRVVRFVQRILRR